MRNDDREWDLPLAFSNLRGSRDFPNASASHDTASTPRMSLLQCNMPTTWPTDYHVSHIRHVCTANTEAMPRDRPAGHSCKPSSGKSPADRDFLASTSLSVKIVTSVSRCARLCPRHHYQRARHLDSSPLRTLCLDDQADSPPTFLLAHSTPSMSCRHWR